MAHHLIGLGVKPDDLVGICVERSLGMVIGILAILKAGDQRLRDISCDASPVCLVADKSGLTAIGNTITKATILVDLSNIDIPEITTNPQDPQLTPSHLAYVICISGTTGKPEGVMIEHQGIVNLVISLLEP